jgi:glycosyltransferase involved in cell wall biosynthesis
MIGDSPAGFVYPAGDAETLAKLILRIATDPAMEAAMRKAALARYLSTYTAKDMANKVTALYRAIAEQKKDLPSR